MSKFKVSFTIYRHQTRQKTRHQTTDGYQSNHLPINTFIFLSVHSTSKRILILPLDQFDIMYVIVNHNFVTLLSFDLIQVYTNRNYSFKLTRHGNFNESFRWKIILGGWKGKRSIIAEQNPNTLCTDINHTENDFDTLKKNFKVTVADKSITITNYENGDIFMTCTSENISKSDLSHMSACSGPWQVSGNFQIEKIKGLLKL